MPWVVRDGNGAISGLFAGQQSFTSEFLPDTDPAVVAFLNPPATPLSNQLGVSFQVLFNHENRIRVLEGKAQITAAQFKAALVALLGG